jgi:hypothetical protein
LLRSEVLLKGSRQSCQGNLVEGPVGERKKSYDPSIVAIFTISLFRQLKDETSFSGLRDLIFYLNPFDDLSQNGSCHILI